MPADRGSPREIYRTTGDDLSHFWDGRAESLEQQVVQPLLNPSEMAMTPDAVIATVRRDRGCTRQFLAAFGREPQLDDVARALARYVRTIHSGNSRYDRFRSGVRAALTQQEQRGMRTFFGKGRCGSCHSGPNLTDERLHNTGVSFRDGRMLDPGRFAVTRNAADRGAFKTPTLREVVRTAPYMHDGSESTLEGVVEYYDRGGNANPDLDAGSDWSLSERQARARRVPACVERRSAGRVVNQDAGRRLSRLPRHLLAWSRAIAAPARCNMLEKP